MSPVDRTYFEIIASVATSVLLIFVHGGEELEPYHCMCANNYSPLLKRM
jgi:hypothetical protein